MSTLRFLTRIGKTSSAFRCAQQQQQHSTPIAAAALVTLTSSNNARCRRFHTSSNGGDKIYKQWNVAYSNAPALFPTLNLEASAQRCFGTKSSPDRTGKSDSKASSAALANDDIFGDTSKLGLFAKFKLMYKKYWYVLIPVHVVTSIGWFAGFYYLSMSGVDVPALLQHMHLSETIIEKVKNSQMGHIAIAYLCYKVVTPIRYALTLGGTTVSIKYLVQSGYIKPMLSKDQLMEMYERKKADRAAAKAEKVKQNTDK